MKFPHGIMLLIRYGMVGAFGALIQIGILWFWVGVLGHRDEYLWGVAFGFVCALATTFPLQKYWTFKDALHSTAPRQFFRYTVIALASLGINMFSMSLAKDVIDHMQLDFFRLWYLLAQAGIVTVVAGLSFLSNKFFTFTAGSGESL